MEFLLSKGYALGPWIAEIAEGRTDQHLSEFAFLELGEADLLLAGELIQDQDFVYIQDGQFSMEGEYFHPLLSVNRSRLADAISGVISARRQAPDNGVFCIGRVRRDARRGQAVAEIRADRLSQYPLYYHTSHGRYLVSNNYGLIVRALKKAGVPVTRSAWVSAENVAIGTTLGDKTQVAEIARLPFGRAISASESLTLVRVADAVTDCLSYEDAVENLRMSVAAHLDAVAASVPHPRVCVADITGGSDSRAVLSFLLNSAFRSEFHGRCLTRYPHADANVAGFLMQEYGVPLANFPVVHAPVEHAVRMNAAFCGGARESGALVSPVALPDFVHFKGSFGELGGATPGIDYVAEAEKAGGYSHEAAVEIFFERRRMARALDLLTEDALAAVKQGMAAQFRDLSEQGYGPQHLIAEFYLRNRCRTHFGLQSFLENKTRILPEPLANQWLVSARRLLPASQHTKNKAVFDLILRNGGEDLAFAPMADKKWSDSIVPDHLRHRLSEMTMVTTESPNLSGFDGPLYSSVPIAVAPKQGLRASSGAPQVGRPAVYPHERYIFSYQSLLSFILGEVSSDDEIWRVYDYESVCRYKDRRPEDFHTNGLDTHAMGIAISGILWCLDLATDPVVSRRGSLAAATV